MVDFCLLLWLSVVGCNPVALNYLEAASMIPAQHLALVREISIASQDHASVAYASGRVTLPARRNDRLLYNLAHEVGHLVFRENYRDLQFRWVAWFWPANTPRGQISGYTARVLATGDWWDAVQEEAADSYAAIFRGDPLDPERRSWLSRWVDGLADRSGCSSEAVAARRANRS